ncbi:MAG: glycosyltransferase, partial [Bacteroidales bacterium]|nr:glycosyltransferase [Bacteroidales bacterium]
MKILHVITGSDLGGAQTVVINLSNCMCFEHDIIVVAGGDGPMWESLNNNVKKIRIKEIKRDFSFFNDVYAFFKLKKIYKMEKPDVIHLHSSKVGAIGRFAFPCKKIIYSVHGFDSIRIAHRRYLWLEKLLKKRCKAIVLASNYDRQNMINEGITNNLCIIQNGVRLPPCTDKDILINDFVKENKKIVMCIARISPQKRFETYIEIAKLLPQYIFVWIGTDKQYDNIPDNLFCLRSFPNAEKNIPLADIFVLPSNYEGVPLVIISALGYGKPIVSSNVGGIREIVINNENGYTVENSASEFAEKIQYILENKSVYKKF